MLHSQHISPVLEDRPPCSKISRQADSGCDSWVSLLMLLYAHRPSEGLWTLPAPPAGLSPHGSGHHGGQIQLATKQPDHVHAPINLSSNPQLTTLRWEEHMISRDNTRLLMVDRHPHISNAAVLLLRGGAPETSRQRCYRILRQAICMSRSHTPQTPWQASPAALLRINCDGHPSLMSVSLQRSCECNEVLLFYTV